ncbi:MAG: formate dehydrogenase accessory sulfurtransferase FdhD [Bacteroidota bacterium]|nr:formate dehydrogenase accessory sulfurtransferase FdhD [Bacteroidota bacterium]
MDTHLLTNQNLKQRNIYRFTQGNWQEVEDVVVAEEPLEIRLAYLGGAGKEIVKSLAVTMRTPGADFDLVRGFLFTEGIIRKAEEILSMQFVEVPENEKPTGQIILVHLASQVAGEVKKIQPRLYMSSSCGLCGKASSSQLQKVPAYLVLPDRPKVEADLLGYLPEKLWQWQASFRQTGGIHACGLFNQQGDLMLLQEDVGRHNAMDKLVGILLEQQQIPVRDHLLLFSGRLSFELVQKAMMVGAPFLCAIGAPSSAAIALAEESGMTLIGILSHYRFNIYTGPERVITS